MASHWTILLVQLQLTMIPSLVLTGTMRTNATDTLGLAFFYTKVIFTEVIQNKRPFWDKRTAQICHGSGDGLILPASLGMLQMMIMNLKGKKAINECNNQPFCFSVT